MNETKWSIPRTRSWGIGLAGVTAVVSGFAVFINAYAVRSWGGAGASSATYTTAKNLVAALVLTGLLALAGRRRRRGGLTRPETARQWIALGAIGLIGGSLPFLLFFEGLSRATSSQAAFLHKTLIVWVALLAIPLLGEKLGAIHFVAIGALVAGQGVLAGGIGDIGLASGETLILLATLLWSVEVILAKRVLADLSSLTVGAARMGLGVLVLIAYGAATGALSGLGGLGAGQWAWALATGAVLSIYVASWYAALARAQAVDVTGMLVFGAVITALLRRAVEGAALAPAGLVLITVGVAALAWAGLRRSPASVEVRG